MNDEPDILYLNGCNELDFKAELNENLGGKKPFHVFKDHTIIRRTLEALDEMLATVDGQLLKYGGDNPDKDHAWEVKANGFRNILTWRMRQVRAEIERMEESQVARERKWKAFAHELVEIIEESDMDQDLDDIEVPFGEITAREWIARRRAKRSIEIVLDAA